MAKHYKIEFVVRVDHPHETSDTIAESLEEHCGWIGVDPVGDIAVYEVTHFG